MGCLCGFWSGEWIDPDFNPEGIREGVYTSCDWNSRHDMYVTDEKSTPVMWASRCPPCQKEFLAYTQLWEAIKKDFGIELSPKPGEEILKVIDDILRVRATDPLLEEMIGTLEVVSEFANNYHWAVNTPLRRRINQVLQKHHEQTGE